MNSMLRELFEHQAWADAAILEAVRGNADARKDEKLRWTLHHIAMAQRGFYALFTGQPFDIQKEAKVPESPADLEVSQNHRGQCLTRLRSITGNAPTLDFIIWVKNRPAAASAAA